MKFSVMPLLLSRSVRLSGSPGGCVSRARIRLLSIGTAVGIQLLYAGRSNGENHADFKYQDYAEGDGRINVQTYSFLFDLGLSSQVDLKGEYTHDAVSGASPTGMPPPAGSSQVPLAPMEDVRNAGFLEAGLRIGRFLTSPQVSFSQEHDYSAFGISIVEAIDFNQKNTTLSFGYAHSFDTVSPAFWTSTKSKDTADYFVGLTQLLSPRAYVTAAVTFGTANGYLADPYKLVRFTGYPDPNAGFAEVRPGYKTKETLYVSGNYFFDAVNGGAEASYRLYHDSFAIWSQTARVSWYQKLGKYAVLSPMFRFDTQTAAYFYVVELPGDPSDPASPIPIPSYYSADYRLSALNTFTYGLAATVMIKERLYLDLAYQRYEMFANNSITSPSAYPKANVYTAGVRLWF